jgi:hypothetical protein
MYKCERRSSLGGEEFNKQKERRQKERKSIK